MGVPDRVGVYVVYKIIILFFSDDYIYQLFIYETLDESNGHIHLCKAHRTCGHNRDWVRARNYRYVKSGLYMLAGTSTLYLFYTESHFDTF